MQFLAILMLKTGISISNFPERPPWGPPPRLPRKCSVYNKNVVQNSLCFPGNNFPLRYEAYYTQFECQNDARTREGSHFQYFHQPKRRWNTRGVPFLMFPIIKIARERESGAIFNVSSHQNSAGTREWCHFL